MAGQSITEHTPQGPRLAMVSEKILVRRRIDDREEEASLDDIEQGVLIPIFGQLQGRTLRARLIMILPPKR